MFDAYIFVDWSARSKPSRLQPCQDAIWVGTLTAENDQGEERYFRTRDACVGYLSGLLKELAVRRWRVIIGFDFPYGYPEGFAAAVHRDQDQPTWQEVWDTLGDLIKDQPDNWNNRFEIASLLNERVSAVQPGPFWGCPKARESTSLKMTSPGFPFVADNSAPLKRLRLGDSRLKGVQETWKLCGVGSVGSQAILGIPRVRALRFETELRDISLVWPFETGFMSAPCAGDRPFILHCEIWPGVVKSETVELAGTECIDIRDQAQVRAMCRWTRDLDRSDRLGTLLDRPDGLNDEEVRVIVMEEGWILGIPSSRHEGQITFTPPQGRGLEIH